MMHRKKSGFTLVEVVISLAVGGILIAAFFTLYTTGVQVDSQLSRRTLAQNIAYKELRKYTETQVVNWTITPALACNSTSDSFSNVNAAGRVVENTDLAGTYELPPPATLVIRAWFPYGCGATENHLPVLVKATVTYGSDAKQEVYANYAKR